MSLVPLSAFAQGSDDFQYPFSLADVKLKTPNDFPLQQNAMTAGHGVIVSSTVSAELGSETEILYIIQVKDEDDIVRFTKISNVTFPSEDSIVDLESTWVPDESGVYTIEVFALRTEADHVAAHSAVPMMEKGRIINVFVGPSEIPSSDLRPAGISLNIEKIGTRKFYQDRYVFFPTNLTITKDDSFGWEVVAWPTIGPNHIIAKIEPSTNDTTVVFDYYKSLGIDDLAEIRYDEFMKAKDLGPPPEGMGRYFGFGWNQTALTGARTEPGLYQAHLIMPVLIGDITPGDDKRTRVVLASEPDFFTILGGKPNDLEHNLSLKLNVSKTDLLTGEPFAYSLVLANNGDHPEFLTIDSTSFGSISKEQDGRIYLPPCPVSDSVGSVYGWYFIHEQPLLPGAERVIFDNSFSEAPKRPGTYYLSGPVIISVADEPMENKSENDGIRASCLEVHVDPIALNVTAPTFEGVELVVSTDRQVYKRNETVTFDLYIENKSDKPFKLSEVQPTIQIIDASSGVQVSGLSYVADYFEYPIIQPNSKFSLATTIPLTWDQTVFKDDKQEPAEPGKYLIKATFTFPYLESEEHVITIE